MGNVVINVSTHDYDTKDLNLSLEGMVLKGTLGGNESTVDLSGIIPANAKDRFLKSGRYEQGTKRLILVTGAEGEQDNEIAIPLEDLLGLSLPNTNTGLVIDTSREVKVVSGQQEFTPVKDSTGYVGYVHTDIYKTEYNGKEVPPNQEGILDIRAVISTLTNEIKGYSSIIGGNTENGWQQQYVFSKEYPTLTLPLPYYAIQARVPRELNKEEKQRLDGYFSADDYVAVPAMAQVLMYADKIALPEDIKTKGFDRIKITGEAWDVSENSLENILATFTPIDQADGAYEEVIVSDSTFYQYERATYEQEKELLTYSAKKNVVFLVKRNNTSTLDFFAKLQTESNTYRRENCALNGRENCALYATVYFSDGSTAEMKFHEPREELPISNKIKG